MTRAMFAQISHDFSPYALKTVKNLVRVINEELGRRDVSTKLSFRFDGGTHLFTEETAARWIMESVDAGFVNLAAFEGAPSWVPLVIPAFAAGGAPYRAL